MRQHLWAGAEGVTRGVVVLGGHPALQVVQQPTGLVLLGVQARQPQQLPLVVARVHHLRHEGDRVAVGRVLDLHLGHVEAQLVQPADTALDVVVLPGRVHRRTRQLLPQPAVTGADLVAEVDRVHRRVQRPRRLQVQQLPADVHPGQVEVVLPLPGAQLRVQITGLGVHEIRGVRARVPPEEGVGQRAVAPREPRQMQPHQQHGQRVHQPVHRRRTHGGLEHRAVRHRTAEVPGDQHRLQRIARLVGAAGDHAEGVHRRDAQPVQVAQQPVLAQRGPLGELLDGDHLVARAGVAHDVPGDTAGERDQVVLGPLLQGQVPRQFEEQRGVFRVGGADLQCHGSSAFVSRSNGCSGDGRRIAPAGASPHLKDRFVNRE